MRGYVRMCEYESNFVGVDSSVMRIAENRRRRSISKLGAQDVDKSNNMVSTRRLGLAGSCMFSVGLISYTIGFPAMLKLQVKSQVRLKKGDEMRDFWEKLPQALNFNIYVFNVTNPNEIKTGAKPILEDIGPFHYDLYRDKEDIVERDEDDTVEYSLKQTWYFKEEQSVMSDNTEIYSFHPVILAIILTAQVERPSAMGVISKAVDSIFKKPESIFIKTTVKDLFFHGVSFDCTDVTDFAGSAVCGVLSEQTEMFIKESGEGLRYRFGYLAKRNGSRLPERIKVYRGIKNYKDVGRMVSIGNLSKLSVWPGDPCNDLQGTDGTIFPPFLKKEKEVWAYFPDLCRSMGAYYVRPGKEQGFKTLHYSSNIGDPNTNDDLKCLCLEYEGCMPKNVFNAYPCLGAPFRISHPHLYMTDPRYLEMVDGLNPDPEKHEMVFDFDAMTGSPIKAFKRIQFNALVGPIAKVKLMKTFPEALFPIFWIEDGIELGSVLIKPLKVAYMQIFLAKIMMWLMMVGGIGMLATSLAKHYKEKKTEGELADMVPKTSKNQSAVSGNQKLNISVIQPGPVPPNIG
ncbi:sensory neuron membrane protein 1-like isoform X2 [Linepithema humile]|uniref:sensory neuron membrane protein 1-like isoform X2 n=1 Tax=Linepithema humile TaxID=83485 RepID=UPI00351DE878